MKINFQLSLENLPRGRYSWVHFLSDQSAGFEISSDIYFWSFQKRRWFSRLIICVKLNPRWLRILECSVLISAWRPVMAIEFSLSELELRRRQNTLVAKSISTDGTEGNLIRNFQVFILEEIEAEKLGKYLLKVKGRANFRWKTRQWRCSQQYQTRQMRQWGGFRLSVLTFHCYSHCCLVTSWGVGQTRTISFMQETTLTERKKKR